MPRYVSPAGGGGTLGKRMASVKEYQKPLTELHHISRPVRDEVKIARRFIGGNNAQPKHQFRPIGTVERVNWQFECPYGTFLHLWGSVLFPAVNGRAIIGNPYGICLGVENDAQDLAPQKCTNRFSSAPAGGGKCIERTLPPLP